MSQNSFSSYSTSSGSLQAPQAKSPCKERKQWKFVEPEKFTTSYQMFFGDAKPLPPYETPLAKARLELVLAE